MPPRQHITAAFARAGAPSGLWLRGGWYFFIPTDLDFDLTHSPGYHVNTHCRNLVQAFGNPFRDTYFEDAPATLDLWFHETGFNIHYTESLAIQPASETTRARWCLTHILRHRDHEYLPIDSISEALFTTDWVPVYVRPSSSSRS